MEYKIYKVVSGDNLTKIAKANNTTVNELVQINGIKNPNLIYVGQEIKIPVEEAAPVAAAAASYATTTYKIKPGDNLTKIAKEFGTTVEELVKLNNIANPNLIIAGADLVVPSAGAKPTAEALAAQEEAIAKAKAALAEAQAKAAQEEAIARAKAALAESQAKEAAADFAAKKETLASAIKEEPKAEEKKGFLSGLFGKKS